MLRNAIIAILLLLVVVEGGYILYWKYPPAKAGFQKMSVLSQTPGEAKPEKKEYTEPPTASDLFKEIQEWANQWKSNAQGELIKYQNALSKKSNDPEANFTLAQIYLSLPDRQKEASIHFQKTLELDPNHPKKKIIQFWCKMHEEQQDRSAMYQEINEQQQRLKDDPQEYMKMARIYKKYNMQEMAYNAYKKSLQLAPENVEWLLEIALFCKEDYPHNALTYFQKIRSAQEKHPKKEEIEQNIKALEKRLANKKALYAKDAEEKEILDALKAQLEEKSIVQKKWAIEKLSEMKNQSALDLLKQTAYGEKDKEIQRVAVSAIRKREGWSILKDMLYEHDNSPLKTAVMLACMKWGSQEDIQLLEKWSKDASSEKHRRQVEWAIEQMKKGN